MPALQGVRNLASFVLSSPNKPRVSFMSSVSVLRSAFYLYYTIAPNQLTNHFGMIYRSRPASWSRISSRTGIWRIKMGRRTCIRLSSPFSIHFQAGTDGAWNAKEWFPGIILSGPYLKCLPDIPGSVRVFKSFFGMRLIQMSAERSFCARSCCGEGGGGYCFRSQDGTVYAFGASQFYHLDHVHELRYFLSLSRRYRTSPLADMGGEFGRIH